MASDFPKTVSTAQMWRDFAVRLEREIATMEAQGINDDHWKGAIQASREDLRLVHVRLEWAKGHDEQINAELTRLRAIEQAARDVVDAHQRAESQLSQPSPQFEDTCLGEIDSEAARCYHSQIPALRQLAAAVKQ